MLRQPDPNRSSRPRPVDLEVPAKRADALARLLADSGKRGETHVAANLAAELRRVAT